MPYSFAPFPIQNSSLVRAVRVSLFVLGALMLLSLLAFPFGYDQVIFSIAGERVARAGGVPYRDFIDTKPPIIFYINAGTYLLFGHHEWGIRLTDLLYMSVTCIYLYRMVRRWTANESLAFLSSFLLILHYVDSGFWMTAQCESFAFLPTLMIVDRSMRVLEGTRNLNSWRIGFSIGLLTAILFLLKFTLIAAPFACLLFVFLVRDSSRKRLEIALISVGTFLLLNCLYVLTLYLNGGLARFIETLEWIRGYAAIAGGGSDGLRWIHSTFPSAYVQSFSFTLAIAGFLGAGILLWRAMLSDGDSAPKFGKIGEKAQGSRFLLLVLFVFFFSMLSVLYERKFFIYQFGRGYWASAIIEALAILAASHIVVTGWRKIRDYPRSSRAILGTLALGTLVVALFFSAAKGIISQSAMWTVARVTGSDIPARIQQSYLLFPADQRDVANFLRPKMRGEDQVFVWGNDQGIYFALDRLPRTICLTNTPFATAWTPAVWRKTLLDQLTHDPPRYIIVESGDALTFITNDAMDSYHLLSNVPELITLITSHYQPLATIGHFMIFEKR